METAERLEGLSICELVERFERDVRSGCHPTVVEAVRSMAGKELQRRADTRGGEIVSILGLRLAELNRRQRLDSVEESVHDGLDMLLAWIQGE